MTSDMPESRDLHPTLRFAWILGLAGLLPFISMAVFSWLSPPAELGGVLKAQAHYAASIFTFLGALHWGVVLARPEITDGAAVYRLVWSVIPSIAAWILTLYGVRVAIPGLFVGLLAAWLIDWRFYRGTQVPGWFMRLRGLLSAGALLCVGASWLAMASRPFR